MTNLSLIQFRSHWDYHVVSCCYDRDKWLDKFSNLLWISFGIVNILSSFVIPPKCLWKNLSKSTDGIPSNSKKYILNCSVIGASMFCSIKLWLINKVFHILPLKISNLGLNCLINLMLLLYRFCKYSNCSSLSMAGNTIPSEW